jgi:hypothetical protein
VTYCSTARECARLVDVLVICSPCREFKQIDQADLVRSGRTSTVIDCWRILDREEVGDVANYIAIGTGDVCLSRSMVAGRWDHKLVKKAA